MYTKTFYRSQNWYIIQKPLIFFRKKVLNFVLGFEICRLHGFQSTVQKARAHSKNRAR